MNTIDTTQAARGLYGLGWLDLPELAREVAADFVSELLNLDGGPNWDHQLSDRAHEYADAGVPIYRSDLLALLADPRIGGSLLVEEGLSEDLLLRQWRPLPAVAEPSPAAPPAPVPAAPAAPTPPRPPSAPGPG